LCVSGSPPARNRFCLCGVLIQRVHFLEKTAKSTRFATFSIAMLITINIFIVMIIKMNYIKYVTIFYRFTEMSDPGSPPARNRFCLCGVLIQRVHFLEKTAKSTRFATFSIAMLITINIFIVMII